MNQGVGGRVSPDKEKDAPISSSGRPVQSSGEQTAGSGVRISGRKKRDTQGALHAEIVE